ncbi:hypothetical protein MUK70_18935 [Dyadobacter chenwenxiniae]|uniref:Uncharacterized protein n=1 Tax=Dyadobacter chenwenxiniae TaxID=2906456 RepID=A0A9X1TCY1_9BACT|nr:hypothetical protein [Dyadobacter chenwenxiniae]MCF0061316.1 hypothetical protein [Dyadobacter chenwenxiniae]UON81138.1 hypothetical protein MUK70_18935 [Dyadobacter chenwenxiniae]
MSNKVNHVPLFKLRLPWYLILEYVYLNWDAFRHDVTGECKNWKKEAVINFEPIERFTFTVIEQQWLGGLHIKIADVPVLQNGALGPVCTAIRKYFSGVGEENKFKEYLRQAFRGQEARSSPNYFQNGVNRHLKKRISELDENIKVEPVMVDAILAIATFCSEKTRLHLQAFHIIKTDIQEGPNTTEPIEFVAHRNFWEKQADSEVFKAFRNTTWIQYEKTLSRSEGNDDWGLATSSLEILNPEHSESLIMKFRNIYGSKESHRSGIVSYDVNGKILVAQLGHPSQQPLASSFFFMTVHNPQRQKKMPGYFVSFSPRRNRYVTKKILWIRVDKEVVPTEFSGEVLKTVDPFIIAYFSTNDTDRVIVPPIVDGNIIL